MTTSLTPEGIDPAMTEPLDAPPLGAQERARLTRFVRVLERQRARPEAMAGFFSGIGAGGVVAALATVAFGPGREDVTDWDVLPILLRDGLHTAATWPDFDAEAFGADLAGLLREADDDRRATVSAVTSFLLASGRYDARLLSGWSRAFDALHLPAEVPLTWSSFLTGADGPRPWTGLAHVARERADAEAEHD